MSNELRNYEAEMAHEEEAMARIEELLFEERQTVPGARQVLRVNDDLQGWPEAFKQHAALQPVPVVTAPPAVEPANALALEDALSKVDAVETAMLEAEIHWMGQKTRALEKMRRAALGLEAVLELLDGKRQAAHTQSE